MNPVVSVVIATRDRPEMVREAIDSVYAQTLDGDIEVIVVADQSEPDLGLVRQEEGRSTRVISNTRSVGLAGARNSGIEAATGEYVAFCDDDDLWLPEKLERQVAALAAAPGAGLSTCGIQVQYGGETFSRSLDAELVTFDDLLRDRHTELHPSTFVMRREALLEVIGLVEEEVPGGFGEDYEFLPRGPTRSSTSVTCSRWSGGASSPSSSAGGRPWRRA
jgi:glycosyltransferase involved in cell wall biosynthesis